MSELKAGKMRVVRPISIEVYVSTEIGDRLCLIQFVPRLDASFFFFFFFFFNFFNTAGNPLHTFIFGRCVWAR